MKEYSEKDYKRVARRVAELFYENGGRIYCAVVDACAETGDTFEDHQMAYIRDRAETFYI